MIRRIVETSPEVKAVIRAANEMQRDARTLHHAPTETDALATRLIGSALLADLTNAGLAVVDAERLAKLEGVYKAAREWRRTSGLGSDALREAVEAAIHQSGDH